VSEIVNIAGYNKYSTVDWPEKIVSVAFLQGCPWKCNYCHNFTILDPYKKGGLPFEYILNHLEKRYGLLDGLVFSGGEPTMQKGLYQAAKKIKNIEFAVGLHTGGAYPENLARVLPLIDWIGFDIKAPPRLYKDITHNSSSLDNAKKSINLVLNSNVNVQFRTTVDPTIMNALDIKELQKWTQSLGIKELVLQEVRDMGVNEQYKKELQNLQSQNLLNK
jgi:pyruvate formate lyase activating enzyme